MSVNGKDGHYDAVIVGSGFGGSVTAYRLAQAGKSRLRPGARPRLPAGLVHAQPVPRPRELLGSAPRPDRHVPLLVLPRDRRARVGGPRRRLAHLRQRLHPQGREVVRAGGPARRRLRVLAGLARRPRPPLRPRRVDDRPAALSLRPRALLQDAEDDRLQGGRRGQRPGVVPAQARGHLRQRGAPAGARRGDRGGAREPPRAHAARRASCAASATWAATTAPRTRSTTTTSRTPPTTAPSCARCATCAASSRARAAATPSTTPRSTTSTPAEDDGARRRCGRVTCDHLVLSAGTLGTTNLLLRNRSAFPRLSRRLGTRFCGNGDLLTLAHQHPRDGRRQAHAADRRSRLRPGHHQHGAHARRARRRRGPRLLPAGRRLSAAAGLDPARPRRAQVAVGVALDRPRSWSRTGCRARPTPTSAATSPTCCSRASCRPAACRCWGWAATSPTGGCSCATAGSTSTGTASARPSTSRACGPPRAASPTRSAGASPTTRSGSCGA